MLNPCPVFVPAQPLVNISVLGDSWLSEFLYVLIKIYLPGDSFSSDSQNLLKNILYIKLMCNLGHCKSLPTL